MVRHLEASLIRVVSLAERLVSPEAHDGQSQGIDGQLVVLHVLAEDIGDAGGPSFPLDLGMIRRVRLHLFEFDSSRVWRLPEIVKNDILDLDIDIRKRSLLYVGLNDVVLAFLLDHGVLHVAIQKIECVGLAVGSRGSWVPPNLDLKTSGHLRKLAPTFLSCPRPFSYHLMP